jgi:uncharacterized protein YndB with AHSA1/START domain
MVIVYWILGIVGAVLALGVVLYVIGRFLPAAHVMSRSVRLCQRPDAVWSVITDYANVPNWHTHVKKAERQPDRNGHELWHEFHKGVGVPLQLETTESIPGRRLVRSIDDGQQFFRGRWEFELTAEADGCRVTITEHGEILNAVARAMARLFFNPAMYLDQYLKALARKFNEEPVLENGALTARVAQA